LSTVPDVVSENNLLKMDLTKVFGLVRVVILVMVTFFSALVLIMGALVTNFTTSVLRGYFVYAAFAIAISCLTLLTVPVMIYLSINRKGAFPSMIVVELGYVGLLWILWLAVRGTIGNIPWINYCSSVGYVYRGYGAACMETQAMAAFSFLNWLMLMVLDIFLLTLAIIQVNRGNSGIWSSCVTDVDYSAPATATTEAKVAYGSPVTPVPQQVPSPVPQQYPQEVPSPQASYPTQVYTPPPQQQAYPPQVYTPPQQPAMPMSAQV